MMLGGKNNFFFFFFGHAIHHVGSYFPDQGSNRCPVQWKHRLLTTGLPGNSQERIIFVRHLLCTNYSTKINVNRLYLLIKHSDS